MRLGRWQAGKLAGVFVRILALAPLRVLLFLTQTAMPSQLPLCRVMVEDTRGDLSTLIPQNERATKPTGAGAS
jgi:hypothetical protein